MTGSTIRPVQSAGAVPTAGDDTPIPVPSGQLVTLQEVIWNEPGTEGLTIRFRFVAPAIAREGGTVPFETAVWDMLALCQTYALPRIAETGPMPERVVVSMSDVPVVFGEADPGATQFFEAYSIEDGNCIWEAF